MRSRFLAAVALLVVVSLALVATAWAEVYSTSVAATGTATTVTFPRGMSSVLIINDDAANAVFYRLFWCGDTVAAATASLATFPNAGSLQLSATESRSFTREAQTEPNFYCALSVIAAPTATVRIEAK